MKRLLFKIKNFFVPYPKYRIVEKIVNTTIELGERGIVNQDLDYTTTQTRLFVVEVKSKKGFYYKEKSFRKLRYAVNYVDALKKEDEEEIIWIYNNV